MQSVCSRLLTSTEHVIRFRSPFPLDPQLLLVYVMGGHWTYGSIIDGADTLTVRLAPIASAPDIYIKLIALNAGSHTGLFVF